MWGWYRMAGFKQSVCQTFCGKGGFPHLQWCKGGGEEQRQSHQLFFARIWPKVKHEKIHITKKTAVAMIHFLDCSFNGMKDYQI